MGGNNKTNKAYRAYGWGLNTNCGESQSPNGDRAPAFSRRDALSSHAREPSARLHANGTQIIDNGWDGFQTQIIWIGLIELMGLIVPMGRDGG